jgi:hypothetical protein
MLLVGLIGAVVLAVMWMPSPHQEAAKLESAQGIESQLERKRIITFARVMRKQEIACLLIDGKISLIEAGARFGALNRANPTFDWVTYRTYDAYRGKTDEERFCREAINAARCILQTHEPARGDLVVGRLVAELERELSQGTLRLPQVVELSESD